MSRQFGSLNRSLPYPSNLQRHSPNISISDLTPSPIPSYTNNSPRVDSDDNSTNTVFHTISQLNDSDMETPDEFQNSKPSPSTFSQPLFRPLQTPTPDKLFPAPSSYTDANPQLSPMTSDQTDPPSSVNEKLENECDNFITLQQQLQNPNTLTIHHLSQSTTSSESSKPASTIEETRVHRVFKRNHPNTPMLPNPRPHPMFSVHPLQTNTQEFLQMLGEDLRHA